MNVNELWRDKHCKKHNRRWILSDDEAVPNQCPDCHEEYMDSLGLRPKTNIKRNKTFIISTPR